MEIRRAFPKLLRRRAATDGLVRRGAVLGGLVAQRAVHDGLEVMTLVSESALRVGLELAPGSDRIAAIRRLPTALRQIKPGAARLGGNLTTVALLVNGRVLANLGIVGLQAGQRVGRLFLGNSR